MEGMEGSWKGIRRAKKGIVLIEWLHWRLEYASLSLPEENGSFSRQTGPMNEQR